MEYLIGGSMLANSSKIWASSRKAKYVWESTFRRAASMFGSAVGVEADVGAPRDMTVTVYAQSQSRRWQIISSRKNLWSRSYGNAGSEYLVGPVNECMVEKELRLKKHRN